jgi:hypothetical protein
MLATKGPRGLELFDGEAWLGIVPFHMINVAPRLVPRFRGFPPFQNSMCAPTSASATSPASTSSASMPATGPDDHILPFGKVDEGRAFREPQPDGFGHGVCGNRCGRRL